MERKTFVDNDGFYIDGINGNVWSDMRGRLRGNAIDRLAVYEDIGLEPEEIKLLLYGLDEYRKYEAKGRLVVLPCNVGDTVYYIDGHKSYKAKAHTFRFNESGVLVYCERNFMGCTGFEGIYGKTVFLTREEAEATLSKGGDE